ncbi:rhamnogalacturonan acetylesterase [Streptomyces sp. N35]|uniref:rhamnogalacturonan acetylesterase n=1 Tax=Streptomyces sp. N35 TaxID=2795730 RepID=UPI0018F48AA3|nr:rhamnogalacturonan acetylesterase [Streptomyces sp. N35]
MSLTRRQLVAATVLAAATVATGAGAASAASGAAKGRRHRTLYIAGDSTAAQKYTDAAPETGWGMALPFFLGRGLTVANHATNGRSSKSFFDEGRLDAILEAIAPGDLLLIQFGHNDSKAADPVRYTEPWSTYQDYLRRYVDGARAAGARPVFATSVERRKFDAAGHAAPSHGEYPAAMTALATEQRVPLLDIQALSIELWDKLGAEPAKAYFNWTPEKQDNTHFSPLGAVEVARMVAGELLRTRVLAARELRRLDDEIPTSWITWPTVPAN